MSVYVQWATSAANAARSFIGSHDDEIDTSDEARIAANRIQPSGSTDPQIGDDGELPAPVTLSHRQAKTRRAVERLIGSTLT